MSEKAPTDLGDALRDLADVCDLNPDWKAFGCLISLDGLRLNFNATHDAGPGEILDALRFALHASQLAGDDEVV
jgi:hypothetical protein